MTYSCLMKTSHPELVSEILAFCGAKGMSKAEFGREAMGDMSFVYDIESGRRECLPRTVRKARDYIAAHLTTGDA